MKFIKPFNSENPLRKVIRSQYLTDENQCIAQLLKILHHSPNTDLKINEKARILVENLRAQDQSTSLMDQFLQEFSLSSEEGIVLMCLAEALLRIPDANTTDALIKDKLLSGDWGSHLGRSESMLVNASTWGLLLTGQWAGMKSATRNDPVGYIKRLVTKSGEPAIRLAVSQAMRFMGKEFVLAENISKAINKAKKKQALGYFYSFDMLGEAACTDKDAQTYTQAYLKAITALARSSNSNDSRENPGISIKLSALHARYELAQTATVETTLYQRLLILAKAAKSAQLGFNIDAEEADRLDVSLSLFEKLAFEPCLAGWDGLGFVVQTYQKRAISVIEWLISLSKTSNHRFMIRLVKGAYWDTEIKHAQELGHADFPVFTRKENTDISYLACAQKMLANPKAIYSQFATHNAHTVASVMTYAQDMTDFEFQCLHGMGEALYAQIVSGQYSCRIYAPVGEYKSLLAYLVRRLLENGANTSFVNLLANKNQDIDTIIANPFNKIKNNKTHRHPQITLPAQLYGNSRINSKGLNLTDIDCLSDYQAAFSRISKNHWLGTPLLESSIKNTSDPIIIENPAYQGEMIGSIQYANTSQIEAALQSAQNNRNTWDLLSGQTRAQMLEATAQLMEQNQFELLTLCQLEAGKTLADAISELREAIDFLRYYAAMARIGFSKPIEMPGPTGELNEYALHGRGVFVCISPWNFPLAIFCGQVAAALVAGNTVIAKPAEQTPLIAWRAVQLFHEAGVPRGVLQLLPGFGYAVGKQLCSDNRVNGVAFTGGTDTAHQIHQTLSNRPHAPLPHLIAETGGLNAMIVDSSALAEQVVRDVISSAFQSAGQRCSALRVLFLQQDIADNLINMLKGAMKVLNTGDQLNLSTDVGPIIDQTAYESLKKHIDKYNENGLLARAPKSLLRGNFLSPCMIEISHINELKKEVFGPILHIIRFNQANLNTMIDSINQSGYGLTLGIHSRINATIKQICARARVGNIYVNRNMIGAVVGTQPFGGEGLSGTGPKAGGPQYLHRYAVERVISTDTTAAGGNASLLNIG